MIPRDPWLWLQAIVLLGFFTLLLVILFALSPA